MKNWEIVEDQKYSSLYESNYPAGDPMRLVNKYKILKNSSCIDLGCGRASLSNYFDNYTGVDVSEFIIKNNQKNKKGKYFHKSLASLEELRCQYNTAICSDVMEHIPPEQVDIVLESISKLNVDIFYFAISTRFSVFLDKNGNNLHLTVMKASDWINKMLKYFIVINETASDSLLLLKAVKKQNNIVIVGNGTSILEKENGELINSFDTVVRFNSFKIENFEKFVGSKTDIWFTVNEKHKKEILNFKEVIVHSWERDEKKCKVFQNLNLERPCQKIEKKFIDTIPCKYPSTGLIAIFYFLQTYPHIFLTGFDWWSTDNHHYGDNEIRGSLHNPKIEYEIIKDLRDNNKLSFL